MLNPETFVTKLAQSVIILGPIEGEEPKMSVAKIIEISSSSKKGFEDAIEKGISRASKTIKHIAGAWVKEQSVTVENGKITSYQVNLMVTFVLHDKDASTDS